ncbi:MULTISPECIES: hypothetical protein [Arthrobacter]|uniref:hypothetical protein n=1 Tax=Arthrobacter TaxID=1663 RepID=UPI001605EC0D|nr:MULTISPECIES: hypothetical protein [Arthrobacter]QYF89021.1 hypothetical protein KY499_12695 [Arthrobacter sp. PAMC25284]
MSQGLIRLAAIWLLGLMLAVAAAIFSIYLVNTSVAGPQQPVREYVAALQKGEGAKALGLLNASVPQGSASMLDGTALQTAASNITDARFGDAENRSGNQVMVPMDYSINGSELHTEFLLERTGTRWLFFSKWSFVPASLPVLDVTVVNSNEASLNGVPVNMPSGRNSFAVFYPGEYEASLNGQYFAAAPTRTTLSGRDTPPPALNLLTYATDGLKDAVSGKVQEFLDSCADEADKQQRLQPDCPFYHATYNRVVDGTIDWSISEYPAVSIEPFGGRWVVAPLNGKARIQARQVDLFSGIVTDLNEVHEFSFTTRLDIAGDTVKVTPLLNF